MKARVKATGEIVEVKSKVITSPVTGESLLKYVDQKTGISYFEEELFFPKDLADEPDYWERIKHQAMIAAMQAIITNPIGFEHVRASNQGRCMSEDVADMAKGYAADLVSKMKEDI